jgi:glycosyltransferase involved in cell wall biosynthesis
MVVLDDGSRDDTPRIIAEIDDHRVVKIRCRHSGRGRALNTAIANSRGEFIAILDADDVALPQRLSLQLDFLRANPEIGVVGSAAREVIDHMGRVLRVERCRCLTDSQIKTGLFQSNPLFHSSVMYRRSLFDQVKGYDERLPCEIDRGLFLRMAPHTTFANLREPLALKREHTDQFFWARRGVRSARLRVLQARLVNQVRAVRHVGAPVWYLFLPFWQGIRALIGKEVQTQRVWVEEENSAPKGPPDPQERSCAETDDG